MKQIVTALILGLTFWNGAAGLAHGESTAQAAIKIGFIADQAPFSAKVEGVSPKGYSIDVCRAVVAEMSGAEERVVEFVETTLRDAFTGVAAGRIDLLCGAITITLERRKFVEFSQPIFRTGAGAMLRTDSPRDLRELFLGEKTVSPPRSPQMQSFATSSIGVRSGSTTEATLRQALAEGGYKMNIVDFPTHAEGLAALEDRKIDGYFADGGLLGNLRRSARAPDDLIIGDKLLTYESYGIAMRRDDPDVRLQVDRALTHLYQADAFENILKTHFGEEAPAIRSDILLQSIPE